jgi:hypothetical protein
VEAGRWSVPWDVVLGEVALGEVALWELVL